LVPQHQLPDPSATRRRCDRPFHGRSGIRVGRGGIMGGESAVHQRALAYLELAARRVKGIHPGCVIPLETLVRWDRGVRLIEICIDRRITGKGVRGRTVGEVVDVSRADMVDERENCGIGSVGRLLGRIRRRARRGRRSCCIASGLSRCCVSGTRVSKPRRVPSKTRQALRPSTRRLSTAVATATRRRTASRPASPTASRN
jgi:hypothetical protein